AEETKEVTWNTVFTGQKGSAIGDETASKQESDAVQKDATNLLSMVGNVLANSPKGDIKGGKVAPANVGNLTDTGSGVTWLMFDVKNIDGKTLSKVPVDANATFAKLNRRSLREPEPDELEAIRKLERANAGGL
ncbi:MAG TPA: hypothetical protein VNC50_02650, partial [Planctomycetia bacterium]|nr:hypothetical protein [Planctomycetia bacterium]